MRNVKGQVKTGGYLVQFNIVSGDTLRDAQKHPEKYRDLLVRVATYSAYFTELSPKLQNDIIARVEFLEV
jgi:choline trimethylamine-lyase